MLTQKIVRGRAAPLIYCETCRERINDATKANAHWLTDEHGQIPEQAEVHFVHKRCNRAFEAHHRAEGRKSAGWESLDIWIIHLANNLKLDQQGLKKAAEQAKIFASVR